MVISLCHCELREAISINEINENFTYIYLNLKPILPAAFAKKISIFQSVLNGWGDAIVSHRTIEPHIVVLRKKLEKNPTKPKHIQTVRGVGYRFRK
ncbi:helix-turn-helix domain-containing protein [Acidobacteriota bacterium]